MSEAKAVAAPVVYTKRELELELQVQHERLAHVNTSVNLLNVQAENLRMASNTIQTEIARLQALSAGLEKAAQEVKHVADEPAEQPTPGSPAIAEERVAEAA